MALFGRLKDLVKGTINEALDAVENPQITVNQMIRDMEQGISEMRGNVAQNCASVKLASAKRDKIQQDISKWNDNAVIAVKQGRDDMAKKALEKKRDLESQKSLLDTKIVKLGKIVTSSKDDLAQLEDKVQEARIKRDTVIAQHRAAEQKKRNVEIGKKFGSRAEDIISGFSSFEEKVERQAAEAEAMREMAELADQDRQTEKDIVQLKRDAYIEKELTALKKQMK